MLHKILKHLLFTCCAIVFSTNVNAQAFPDPTHWTYTVKKMSENQYVVSFKLQLDKGWHIWAMDAGGDGLQIVPSFVFDENKNIELIDEINELGTMTTTTMEGVEGEVNFYSDKVTYFQNVKGKAGTVIKGKHEYQVCNDMMCLPSKELDFTFTLK